MKPRASSREHCRRLAAQIFTQLPEDRAEALTTLRYVRDILRYLGETWPAQAAANANAIQLLPVRKGPEEALGAAVASRNDPPGTANRASPLSEPES